MSESDDDSCSSTYCNFKTNHSRSDSKKRSKRRVCWDSVTVFSFPNILGDHPGLTEVGAPLTIGWKHRTSEEFDVEYFEFLKTGRPQRKRKDLMMPGNYRDAFFLTQGYTLHDIVVVTEEMRRVRRSRAANMRDKPWDKFRNVFEKTTRTLRNRMLLNYQQQQQQQPKLLASSKQQHEPKKLVLANKQPHEPKKIVLAKQPYEPKIVVAKCG